MRTVICLLLATIILPITRSDNTLARAEGTVSVGLARIDITPDFPVRLAGYAGRMAEATEVAAPLWAKALALGDDEGDGPAVLLVVENAGVTAELRAEILERLRDQKDIRPERFVIASTHTHSAPHLPDFAPWHYTAAMPPDQVERLQRYRRELADRLEKVAFEALAARRPGRLAWSQGSVDFGANRRRLQEGRWVGFLPSSATESPGPVDHSLPVLRVTDLDGNLVGLIANYACHCTTTSGSFNEIHGDWAGYAQMAIEERHPGAVAMVAIGCGADVGPYPNGTLEHARQYGRQIADEVDRLLGNDGKPVAPELAAQQAIIQVPLGRLPTREELQQRTEHGRLGARDFARHLLAILDRGDALAPSFDYTVTTWTFGNDLAMVFLPGEVTIDYALRLKHELDGSRLWVTAFANDVPCYISSRRLLDEGGYEVDSSMISYGQPTRLAPEAEDTVINAVLSLMPPQFQRQ